MKKAGKVLFKVLFVISVICNLLLSYYLYENLRPIPSVMRFGFDLGKGETVIYCETSADISVIDADFEEKIYKIGDAEIYKDDIYCAGKSAFETEKETAELFGRTPCSICYQ